MSPVENGTYQIPYLQQIGHTHVTHPQNDVRVKQYVMQVTRSKYKQPSSSLDDEHLDINGHPDIGHLTDVLFSRADVF